MRIATPRRAARRLCSCCIGQHAGDAPETVAHCEVVVARSRRQRAPQVLIVLRHAVYEHVEHLHARHTVCVSMLPPCPNCCLWQALSSILACLPYLIQLYIKLQTYKIVPELPCM